MLKPHVARYGQVDPNKSVSISEGVCKPGVKLSEPNRGRVRPSSLPSNDDTSGSPIPTPGSELASATKKAEETVGGKIRPRSSEYPIYETHMTNVPLCWVDHLGRLRFIPHAEYYMTVNAGNSSRPYAAFLQIDMYMLSGA